MVRCLEIDTVWETCACAGRALGGALELSMWVPHFHQSHGKDRSRPQPKTDEE